MLSSKYRLQKKKDILRVLRYGQIFRSRPFSIRLLPNGETRSRFSIIIGKEVDKRSTRRNRLKRVVRALLQKLLPEIKPGFDVTIRLHVSYPPTRNSGLMREELEKFIRKTPLL